VSEEDRALAIAYGDIIGLEWPDVAEFYGLPIEEEDNDGE